MRRDRVYPGPDMRTDSHKDCPYELCLGEEYLIPLCPPLLKGDYLPQVKRDSHKGCPYDFNCVLGFVVIGVE